MTFQTRRAGGHTARRLLIAAALVFAAALTPSTPSASTVDPQSNPTITVREERGVYSVSARFDVPATPAKVLAVLTDYEAIPRFMPEINTSVVLERALGHAVVEQEAITRLMMFSKRVHLVLEISEERDALRFRDRCTRSFARYEGSWRMTEQNGRTHVVYELIAQPSFDVPEFVLKRLLKRNSVQMIGQLQREIALRSVSAVHVP